MNERAPHLARYGADRLLAAWESSSQAGDLSPNDANRKLYVQTRSLATGAAEGAPLEVEVRGSRHQDFVAFPDGSVAYAAPGSSASKIEIVAHLAVFRVIFSDPRLERRAAATMSDPWRRPRKGTLTISGRP